MSKIKTYYHDEILRLQQPRTPAYRATLAVQHGEIHDSVGLVQRLRDAAAQENAYRTLDREAWDISGHPPRYWKVQRVELKYRGPRRGNRYRTPRETATHVDVYLYERTIWASARR